MLFSRIHRVLAAVTAAALAAACSDGTGPSDSGGAFWGAASGWYTLVHMTGGPPPYRYLDPANRIGTDLDSLNLRLSPDGTYLITLYPHGITARPTFHGYWSPTDSLLTLLSLDGGTITNGSADRGEVTIHNVGALMPGFEFGGGLGTGPGVPTDFDLEREGSDNGTVAGLDESRLLVGKALVGLAVSPEGAVVATAPGDHRFVHASLPFRHPAPVSDAGENPMDVAFGPGNGLAYVTESIAGALGVYDVASGARVAGIAIPGSPLRVRAGGGALFVTTSNGADSIFRVDPATRQITARAVAPVPNALAVSDDGTRIYVGGGNGSVLEYDAALTLLRSLAIPASGNALALSADGGTIYITHGTGVEAWSLGTGTLTAAFQVPPDVFDIALQPVTGTIFVSQGGGGVYRLNPAQPTDVVRYEAGGKPRRIGFTAAGNAVVANEGGWIDVLR